MLAPKQESITAENGELNFTLKKNIQYLCPSTLSNLSLSFEDDLPGFASSWSIIFTTSTGSVALPETVKWSIADPIFEANKTYWLSFISLGEDSYLGVWSVIGEVNNK